MNCKKCGAEISEDTVFCDKCGAKQLASGGLTETLNDSDSRGNDREAKEDAKMKDLQTLKEQLRSGDSVKFGYYEQGNGIEPIEWRVLEKSEKGILLITKYAVDCKEYHETHTAITWEKCNLRKWLNNDFLNSAFNQAEKNLIADTLCPAGKNPQYNISPGKATTDKVFLLSLSEVEKYFKSDEDRRTAPTAYAKKRGAYINGDYTTAADEPCCSWWLRSPGFNRNLAANVLVDGSVDFSGFIVNYGGDCVRPALWIEPDS